MSNLLRLASSRRVALDPTGDILSYHHHRHPENLNSCSRSSKVHFSFSSSSSASASTSRSLFRATAVDQEINSLDGVSYEVLRQKLDAGEWESADEETRRLLCVLAGEAAVKRKWVYFSEVRFIPVSDLRTLDHLWRSSSGNKFGYSVQRRLWKSVNRSWSGFFKKVEWTRVLDERNDTYRKFPIEFMWDNSESTPDGHLPLTNCLRGTQLLQEILLHPAFDEIEQDESMSSMAPVLNKSAL